MSSSLVWRPAEAGTSLPDKLRLIEALGKPPWHFGESMVSTLGVAYRASGLDGFKKLIEAIEKHGEIIVEEQW